MSSNITPLYFFSSNILSRKGTHQSENLENFKWSVQNSQSFLSFQKSENLHFNNLFLSKVYKVWAKKYTGVIFQDTDHWCKIWINSDLWFHKNDMTNLVNFHQSTQKSERLNFNGIFLSKVYNTWTKKLHMSYVS